MSSQVSSSDRYIISESQELSLGESRKWVQRIKTAFPALKYKNYRLYFVGQLVSFIGSWLQNVAQGWLVWQLSQSAFWVGTIAALNHIPILLFALFGGVIVDRVNRKKLIMLTQIAFMLLAFILGILTITKTVTIWHIALISFLTGIVVALDNPARQSFVVDIVGKEDLHSAVALNSSVFNGARIIGPAAAGVLIAIVGTGGAFIINGVSFLAVIFALLSMNISIKKDTRPIHPLKAIKEGIVYAWNHPVIKLLLCFAAVNSIFGWSYATIMPVIARQMLNQDAGGLGLLYTASGIGALVASVIVSIYGKKINKIFFILGGNMLFTFAIFSFSFTNSLISALPFLILAGFILLIQFSTVNTALQGMVEDKLRGRIMSLYTLVFIGLSPLGSLQVGFLADSFGPGFAIRFGAFIVFLTGIALFMFKDKIRKDYSNYKGSEKAKVVYE